MALYESGLSVSHALISAPASWLGSVAARSSHSNNCSCLTVGERLRQLARRLPGSSRNQKDDDSMSATANAPRPLVSTMESRASANWSSVDRSAKPSSQKYTYCPIRLCLFRSRRNRPTSAGGNVPGKSLISKRPSSWSSGSDTDPACTSASSVVSSRSAVSSPLLLCCTYAQQHVRAAVAKRRQGFRLSLMSYSPNVPR